MLHLLCLVSLAAPQGGDWPHYRGPERTGIVAAREWSPDGAAQPLWRANVGKGYSCPSIVAGRLVTMGFDERAGVDRVVCLDAVTGKQLWQHEYAASDQPQFHGGGTLTTPTVHDGRVYCVNRLGVCHALDLADGRVLWKRDYMRELAVEKTFHGFSASPLLDGERIYLQFGGLVFAVDTSDGELVWRTEDLGDAAYSNPALLAVGGTPALAVMRATTFYVLARDDGRELYRYEWPLAGSAVHCAVPVPVGDDRVFLSTAYNKGAAMLRLGDDGQVEKVWANRRMRNKVTACVLHEGHLYGFDESMLRCLDLDGESKWRVRGLGLGSLSMAGGRLLVLSSDGELIVAEADPAGFRELSRRKVLDGGVYWTMPVFVDGLIYVRNSLGDLACLDHRRSARQPTAVPKAAIALPAAQGLFAKHAEAVGADAVGVEGKALRLRGTWAIRLRGLMPEPMTLTLAAPDRWIQHLDEGGLDYAFDGTTAWAIEPQGSRIVKGAEATELQALFPLPQLFAPACPTGAEVSGPVLFAGSDCWKVDSKEGEPATTRTFYFDVATGALRGSDGTGRSRLEFHGTQRLAGLTLPRRIARYRAEDGQAHIIEIESAEWCEIKDTFAMPASVERLMRSPAEIARDTEALRERFRAVLGSYKLVKPHKWFGAEPIDVYVRDGEVWWGPEGDRLRVCVEQAKGDVYPLEGIPVDLAIVTDPAGGKTIVLIEPGDERVHFERLRK